jgi:hypothetical protein
MQLSLRVDLVANTVAALSAERLAVRTRNTEAARHALRYRKLAFDGLAEAIRCFSTDNSEAILACYLCWQFIAPE